MQPNEFFTHLTWLDWCVLGMLALTAMAGLKRGFVLGALDLAGPVVALAVARSLQEPAATLTARQFDVPDGVANITALLILFLAARAVYGLLTGMLFGLAKPVSLLFGPLALVDRALGVLPGLAVGLLAAGLALLPLTVLPLSPEIAETLRQSVVAARVAEVGTAVASLAGAAIPLP